jgi:predicted DNA-binding protein
MNPPGLAVVARPRWKIRRILLARGPWNGRPIFALTGPLQIFKLALMVVHLRPETESRLKELSATTGRAPEDLVEDAMAGYLAELAELRSTLDVRYDDIKGGRVKPVDGEEAFKRIRARSDQQRRS